MRRVRLIALGLPLASVCAVALVACGGGQRAATTTVPAPVRHVRPLPPGGVRIHWRKAALRPAPRAGHVCIVTYKTGRFCATYRKGEIPASALKIKLLEHGFIPVAVE